MFGIRRQRDVARRRYRELIEALPLVTYVDEVDDNATNVYTSPQVEQLLGWTPEEWLADPNFFEKILHPDDRERVLAEVRRTNATRRPFLAEYRLLHRDGRSVWVRDQSRIVEDSRGKLFAQGFLLDLTAQKRLERRLQSAQKMEALGHLAGGVAHDFNNHLTGILGYAEIAAAATTDPAAREPLEAIRESAAQAAELTARLLALSNRDMAELQPVDLNGVVRRAGELLEHLARPGVGTDLQLAPQLPPVLADAARLEQAVVNLALNALDAMPGDGVLTLETLRDGGDVLLRVCDTGRGMDDDTRARAFDPFFSTKESREGAGLGLAVVQRVVESLGGTVEVASSPGNGTTVEVRLPSAEAEDARGAPKATHGGRVLVVEDRDLVRELTRDVLRAAGFEVEAAATGEQAIEIAAREPLSLLVTDVVMPELSGPELVRRLRERQPGLPVLYMSGYTDDVLEAEELAQPGTAFLRKPFGMGELTAKARELTRAAA